MKPKTKEKSKSKKSICRSKKSLDRNKFII